MVSTTLIFFSCILWICLMGLDGVSKFVSHQYQRIQDPAWNQNPSLNRFGNGSRSCFVGFRCFGKTSCSFHFAFSCVHLPSFSFHVHSFPIPFIFLSCSFQCALVSFYLTSFAWMFLSCCIHILFTSFLMLWKWLSGLARGPSATNVYR